MVNPFLYAMYDYGPDITCRWDSNMTNLNVVSAVPIASHNDILVFRGLGRREESGAGEESEEMIKLRVIMAKRSNLIMLSRSLLKD